MVLDVVGQVLGGASVAHQRAAVAVEDRKALHQELAAATVLIHESQFQTAKRRPSVRVQDPLCQAVSLAGQKTPGPPDDVVRVVAQEMEDPWRDIGDHGLRTAFPNDLGHKAREILPDRIGSTRSQPPVTAVWR